MFNVRFSGSKRRGRKCATLALCWDFFFRRRQWRWFGFEDCRRQWFLIRQPFEYLLGFECSLDEIDKCVVEKWLFNFCHHVGQTRRRGIHFQNVPGHQQHRHVRGLLVF